VKQVTSPATDEVSIQAAGKVHRSATYDNGPLKLIGSREYDGRGVRKHLEQALKSGLDSRERTAMIRLDLLVTSFSIPGHLVS
jgi:hypothetical protein